jgi:hypothetical protein
MALEMSTISLGPFPSSVSHHPHHPHHPHPHCSLFLPYEQLLMATVGGAVMVVVVVGYWAPGSFFVIIVAPLSLCPFLASQ